MLCCLADLPGRFGDESGVHRHPLEVLPLSTVTSSKDQIDK